jgi:hypothetical protein
VLLISSKTFFLYLKLLLLNYEGTGSWRWFNLQNARGQLKTDMGQGLMLRTVSNMNIPIFTLFSSSSAWKGGEPHIVIFPLQNIFFSYFFDNFIASSYLFEDSMYQLTSRIWCLLENKQGNSQFLWFDNLSTIMKHHS